MQIEKFPFRCPVWSCGQGYPYFKTEDELTLHLELTHPRSVKKNGLEKLVQDSKDWAKAPHNLWGR